MATIMTASTGSGHLTGFVTFDLGPFKACVAHYSMPAANTAVFPIGFNGIKLRYMESADNSTWANLTASAIGLDAQVSGLVAGQTGHVFIMGH